MLDEEGFEPAKAAVAVVRWVRQVLRVVSWSNWVKNEEHPLEIPLGMYVLLAAYVWGCQSVGLLDDLWLILYAQKRPKRRPRQIR